MKKPDLTGQRFVKLVVTGRHNEKLYNEDAWICKCDCGNDKVLAAQSHLLKGRKKSCGCLRKESPKNVIDMTGKRFGMLTVISRSGRTKRDTATWLCRCDCGEEVSIIGTSLRRGEAVSCGCQRPNQLRNARNILLTEKSVDGVQIPLLNKRVRSDSSTGHKGVHKRIKKGREYYEVNITVKGKRMYASSTSLEEAIQKRQMLEKKYHTPFIEKVSLTDEEFKETILHPKPFSCEECGKVLTGRKRKYCHRCRELRRKTQVAEARKRGAAGLARKLGTQDKCISCGRPFIIKAPRQTKCEECSVKYEYPI